MMCGWTPAQRLCPDGAKGATKVNLLTLLICLKFDFKGYMCYFCVNLQVDSTSKASP